MSNVIAPVVWQASRWAGAFGRILERMRNPSYAARVNLNPLDLVMHPMFCMGLNILAQFPPVQPARQTQTLPPRPFFSKWLASKLWIGDVL